MLLTWLFAALHLLALAIGFGAIWARSRALSGQPDLDRVRRALYADTFWGIAALVWVSTGLIRAFGGLEKGSDYYLSNSVFWLKMGLLLLVIALEIWPMMTLIRWRLLLARGETIDTQPAGRITMISRVQVVLIIGMLFAATAMARGLGT